MDLKSRSPMMTLDTACRHHPGAVFEFYLEQNRNASIDPSVVKAMKKANCELEVKPLDPKSFFEGSPFQDFARDNMSKVLANARYHKTMVTDIFRAAVLWHHGGWYLDTDLVVLRSLGGMKNVLGFQEQNYVNGAVMHLPDHSSFVNALAREASSSRWAASRRVSELHRPLDRAQALIRAISDAWALPC